MFSNEGRGYLCLQVDEQCVSAGAATKQFCLPLGAALCGYLAALSTVEYKVIDRKTHEANLIKI